MIACSSNGVGNRMQHLVRAILPSTQRACGVDAQSPSWLGWKRDSDVGATFLDLFEPPPELLTLETAEEVHTRECSRPCGVGSKAKCVVGTPDALKGTCISSAEDAHRCDAFLAKVSIARELRVLVDALLPERKHLVAVHLRGADSDLELPAAPGRRLGQGHSACHPPEAFATAVAEHLVHHRYNKTVIYVATGVNALLQRFTQHLSVELEQRSHNQLKPKIVSAADVLSLASQWNVSWAIEARTSSRGEARSSVVSIKIATADLYALSSARLLFLSLESSFALLAARLAAAIHARPR